MSEESKSLRLSVVSPARTLYEGLVTSVILPTSEGMIGILRNHAPLVAVLGYGILTLNGQEEGEKKFVVDGGFLEVSNNKITVLADSAELLTDVTKERAEASLNEAMALPANTPSEKETKESRIKAAKTRIKYAS